MQLRGVAPGPKGSNPDRCKIADVALANIEDTYWDYNQKCDILKAISRTDAARAQSVVSVTAHHGLTGCQHCLGMQAFCQLHLIDPNDTRPDLVHVVCEKARNALPSAYGHLVLGLVFSVVAGLRSLPADDRSLFLRGSISHLRHCDHLHIGCLYLGHACVKVGLREDAFNAFRKGSKLGLQVLCLKGSSECYRTGFGVEQDSQEGQRLYREAESEKATFKDVFFKEWEKNVTTVKGAENLVEGLRKWVKDGPTLPATPVEILHPQAGSNVLPVPPPVVATRSGETPTRLWL